jgi:hypothetical protein
LHTDGVFGEDSYEDERMHLHGLLGVGGKPILTWNPGCESWPSSQCARYKDSANNAQLLQRLLYWGVQPMVPFARNDHGITRTVAERGNDTQTFVAYGNLFRALRGRRWVYAAHAAELLNSSTADAAINIFSRAGNSDPRGGGAEQLVLVVSLATPGTTLVVALRGVARSATTASLRLLVPGGDPANEGTKVTLKRPPRNSRHGGGAAAQSLLNVRVGQHGCCVVLLPAASSKL